MAYIGRVVVDAALLEYAAARFDAAAEGLRGQACEDRALEIVKKVGKAMELFRGVADDRPHLRWLADDIGGVQLDGRNVGGLLGGRHFIAHAVAQGPALTDDGEAALFILSPRSEEPETMVTLSQLKNQARLLQDARQRIDALTESEVTGQPPGPPLYFGRPENWGR